MFSMVISAIYFTLFFGEIGSIFDMMVSEGKIKQRELDSANFSMYAIELNFNTMNEVRKFFDLTDP